MLPHLVFHRRLVILSGKGGVGKSTLTAALAILAARQNKRVLVVELAGQSSMSELLGGPAATFAPIERLPGIFTLSVTPEESMEEYLVRELHSRRLYQLIFRNEYVGPFINAVPGLEDLVSIGKVMDLERAVDRRKRPCWDLILVDAPSTGQGLNLLRVSRAMMDMTRVGPFYQNTKIIHDLLVDARRTLLLLITLPEEMPVNETLEMYRTVRHELGVAVGPLIVNNLRSPIVGADRVALLKQLADRGPVAGASCGEDVRAVLASALEVERRVAQEEAYVARLIRETGLPLIRLPSLSTRHLEARQVETLANLVGGAIESLATSAGSALNRNGGGVA